MNRPTPYVRPLAFALCSSFLFTGCFVAKSASTGATDTGEQLRFRADRKRFKVKEREVTGATDHYNSSGDYVGTSENVRMVEKTKLGPREVYFYQGSKRIGEADYYRIGGDEQGAKLANDKQSKLWWMNVGGYGLMATSVGLTVGSLSGAFGDGGGMTLSYIGSSVVGSAGAYLLYHVILKRKDARMPLERARGIGIAF